MNMNNPSVEQVHVKFLHVHQLLQLYSDISWRLDCSKQFHMEHGNLENSLYCNNTLWSGQESVKPIQFLTTRSCKTMCVPNKQCLIMLTHYCIYITVKATLLIYYRRYNCYCHMLHSVCRVSCGYLVTLISVDLQELKRKSDGISRWYRHCAFTQYFNSTVY